MPKITQQTNKAPAVRKVPMATQEQDGMRTTLYGRGKTGKTRLAATFPKPLLFIGTEDGTKSICTKRKEVEKLKCGAVVQKLFVGTTDIETDFIRLTATSQLDEVVEIIKARYASTAVDTAGGLQDLILKEVLGIDEIPVQKSWGLTTRENWGIIGMQTKERLRALLTLSESHGKHICVIAHERNFNDEGAQNDMIFPTVGAALTPSVVGWLNGACDYICQTFLREQVKQSTAGAGIIMNTKTGVNEYCLRIGPHPVFMTGFRLAPGREIPDVIVDPAFDKIWKLING